MLNKLASEYAINELTKSSSFAEIEIAENVLVDNEITKAYKEGYHKAMLEE